MKTKLIKTIMSWLFLACALVSLVAVALGFGTSGTALADSPAVGCSAQTLRGSYGTLTVPFATVSVNGLILHFPPGGTGTYTLNQNCQGTLTFNMGPINYDIFVRSYGREIEMIETNDNSVLNGTAEKVLQLPPR